MSTQPIRDYLTKQLSIENNIVTYRSLSRALALNVNVAKNELAEFHATDGQQMAATYLLSGSIQPEPRNASQDSEDVDMRDDDEDEDEEIEYTQLLLVGEKDLESAQAQFTRLESIHVYSLSPAVIRDAGLLCTPTDIVRDLDNKKGAAMASAVGRVIAANVTKSIVNPFRGAARVMAAPTRSTADLKKKEEEATKPKDDASKPKPKATGKLDFSKAKTKPLKEEEKPKPKPAVAQVKTEPPPQPKAGPSTKTEESSSKSAKRKSALRSDSEEEEEEVATKAKPEAGPSTIAQKVLAYKSSSNKRGVKRKSALLAESDSEEEKAAVAKPAVAQKEKANQEQEQSSSSLRVRKGVVLSDSEDGEDHQPKPKAEPSRLRKGKGKGKVVSEAEKTLHELMDIDDDADGVTRASRDAPPQPADGQDVDMNDVEEDVNMSDADAPPKRALVKRKPKKVVPVGRNGLKKKRVVKSKVHFDDKGYMVTEDVSEYESVDEEEEIEVLAKGKGKSKGKGEEKEKEKPKAVEEKKGKAKAKPVPVPAPEKAKPKPKPSGKSGQQSVADFFGKGKAK